MIARKYFISTLLDFDIRSVKNVASKTIRTHIQGYPMTIEDSENPDVSWPEIKPEKLCK
jgi:hypothetical protein